jgi:NTE family protein
MTKQLSISLALHGGGTHAAFAWGVVDRILEDESLRIEAISGSSMGAMNGALVTYGISTGNRDKARELLTRFWKGLSESTALLPFKPSIVDKILGNTDLQFSPGVVALDYISRIFAPHQFNLFDINPLRDILCSLIDFSLLQKMDDIHLFVNAANVRTGKNKVFSHERITVDALLASACLPYVFKTVEIDGEAYWDGGYTGNPSLLPLLYHTESKDILLIQTHPMHHEDIPKKAPDIMDRATELAFNTNLIHELRSIALVNRLIDKGGITGERYRKVHMHWIESEEMLSSLGRASKLNTDWEFLLHLKEVGYQVASDWLERYRSALGKTSTMDIDAVFL